MRSPANPLVFTEYDITRVLLYDVLLFLSVDDKKMKENIVVKIL